MRVVCVLGMHSSGTSCLTGSLQEAGLYLGSCHTWNPYNLKGNRENQDFVDLHDAILAANGGAWDHPPKRVQWKLEHKQRALELLSQNEGNQVMGFKDPRTLLVLDGWKELVPAMQFVGTFRHPDAVADSLKRRSKMSRAEALNLWYAYNKRLYHEYKYDAFPIVCFDLPESVFQTRLGGVIEQLGLHDPGSGQQFYDSELKNYDTNPGNRLPWKVGRLYRRLCEICV